MICSWCDLSREEKRYLLYESEHWTVFLADEQDYIGRCILVLRRHCGSLAELQTEEWANLQQLIRKLEECLKSVLGADLCNWSCLMNSFYRSAEPDPHVHIHVRPRYKNPLVISGNVYFDEEFGHHYGLHKKAQLRSEDRETVFQSMKAWLNP